MTDYNKQAQEFLDKCNARMEIIFVCRMKNEAWQDVTSRNRYEVVITTPKGTMAFTFWDSTYNTNNCQKPSAYSILACLEKYDVGTIDDFVREFGYEVHKWSDVKRIEDIYNAVVKEYNDLCRIFTPEQMEMLREIY